MGRAFSCCRYEIKREITLLLIGLDNAGKTCAAKLLNKETTQDVVPTIGFSNYTLRDQYHAVTLYDLGGGSKIRGIWNNYYAYAHGLVFVVDSADVQRIEECKTVFMDVIQDPRIQGKPILLLVNKQDLDGALDEVEVCKQLDLERLVNLHRCPTRVETTVSASGPSDLGLQQGYHWLQNHILVNYEALNGRVAHDSLQQREAERSMLQAKMEHIQHLREQRKEKVEELDEGVMVMGDPFRPISSYGAEAAAGDTELILRPLTNGRAVSAGSRDTPRKHFKNKVGPQPMENGSPGKVNWGPRRSSAT